jgi:hypothetical protein
LLTNWFCFAAAKEAAKKLVKGAKGSPPALKRDTFSAAHGTTEVVPFPFR